MLYQGFATVKCKTQLAGVHLVECELVLKLELFFRFDVFAVKRFDDGNRVDDAQDALAFLLTAVAETAPPATEFLGLQIGNPKIHGHSEQTDQAHPHIGVKHQPQGNGGAGKQRQNVDEKDKQKGSLDSSKDFNSQNITECIQRSDIYIDNNQDKKDTLYRQIFRYLSLIVHPGLITPSKDELIMQIALNAKFNSGCISRQVGAVVLNKHGSVKSIGWNEVPEGQVPCLLRSHSELLNNSTLNFYSKYEKSDFKSKDSFKYIFSTTKQPQYKESDKLGLNDSFCFKSIQNEIDGQKNQVYTRSLHAEENAFLQASKYGNSEIIGGQLFTTASPCFLCAKKAYQLGIKRVVYIEAYPDISNEQVFEIGSHDIEVVHFRGATGLAYQKLYEPIFSYKDELKALNKKEKRV